MARTPRGRVATPAAWEQLGLVPRGARPRRACDAIRLKP